MTTLETIGAVIGGFALWLLIAFVIGCIIGNFIRKGGE